MKLRVEDNNIDGRGRFLTTTDARIGLLVRVPGTSERPSFVGRLDRVYKRAYRVDGITYRIDVDGWPTVPARDNNLDPDPLGVWKRKDS